MKDRAVLPPPGGVTTLFDEIRDQLRLAITLLYVGYAVIVALVTRASLRDILTLPLYQLAMVCLALAVLTLLGRIQGHRPNLLVQVMMVPLMIYAGYAQTANTPLQMQAAYLFWSTLVTLPLFLHGGSRNGAVLAALVMGALLVGVLMGKLGSGESLLIWMTGLVAMLTISVLSYILMRFIEQNLSLHEQASGKLKAARLDALTGVANRASQEEDLRRAIDQANASRSALSIIVADIDHFKQVNDVHGHNVGDDVLRAFAKRLRRNVGAAGVVGRWGGEEFLVMLPSVSREDALVLAEQLRTAISETAIAGLPVTASFGVAGLRPPRDDLEQLFARADQQLYKAKEEGRNAVR